MVHNLSIIHAQVFSEIKVTVPFRNPKGYKFKYGFTFS